MIGVSEVGLGDLFGAVCFLIGTDAPFFGVDGSKIGTFPFHDRTFPFLPAIAFMHLPKALQPT